MTDDSYIIPSKTPAPGWVGGFEESNPEFAYPICNLSSLPMSSNMDNMPGIQRQLDVLWPEFTWQTVLNDDSFRCFSMFAPDISRVGYNDKGQVFALICPQQGIYSEELGVINVEVTVTGTRGWVNETSQEVIAADLTVAPRIWISPSKADTGIDHGGMLYESLSSVATLTGLPFPLSKETALVLNTFNKGNPSEPIFSVRAGIDETIADYPANTIHDDVAWNKAHLEVEIGSIRPSPSPTVDEFNALLLSLFNVKSGNLLLETNVLTWNVWFDAPTKVIPGEWKQHAIKWRNSIDEDLPSPDGPGRLPAYRNGQPLVWDAILFEEILKKIDDWFVNLLADYKDTKLAQWFQAAQRSA